jgi:hypothetical protein
VAGDFNNDGVVIALDFNALATHCAQSFNSPSLGGAVPEPTSVVIVVSAIAALRRRKRT